MPRLLKARSSAGQTNAQIATWLFSILALSAFVRALVATRRASPIYYPDEYLYASLSRSISATGIPRVRGASAHFPALLGPFLAAPAWLIQSVEPAYHVALGLGSLWFSAASIPAYLLAREIGVSSRGSLFVALLSVAIPAVAFTTTLLMEPYAYPIFVLTFVVAIRALADPTRSRQAALLALMGALTLIRLQFIVLPLVYLLCATSEARSFRVLWRRQRIVTVATFVAAAVVIVVGVAKVAGVYAGISTFPLHPISLVQWLLLNAFVLGIAAGWVLVPGAVAGMVALVRSPEPKSRAFGYLTIGTAVALLAEAAFFGAAESRVHERYSFYCIPAVAAAFMWFLEQGRPTPILRLTAYVCAALAILLPLGRSMAPSASDESPTVLGLYGLVGNSDHAALVWGIALAALVLMTGLRRSPHRLAPALALACVIAISSSGTIELLRFGRILSFQLGTPVLLETPPKLPANTAILTTQTTNRFWLMQTLFWNRHIQRVLVLGGGPAVDGYSSSAVRFTTSGRLVYESGRPVSRPVVVDDNTAILVSGGSSASDQLPSRGSFAIFSGLNHGDGYMQTVSWLRVFPSAAPQVVTLWLRSKSGPRTLFFDCGDLRRTLTVRARPAPIRLGAPTGTELRCRISLIRGAAIVVNDRTVAAQVVRARLAPAPRDGSD